jgi:ABC-type anion transport system duplicated permease subunit
MVIFEFLEMLALISLVLFARDWYTVLKTCAHKKSLPQELTSITK